VRTCQCQHAVHGVTAVARGLLSAQSLAGRLTRTATVAVTGNAFGLPTPLAVSASLLLDLIGGGFSQQPTVATASDTSVRPAMLARSGSPPTAPGEERALGAGPAVAVEGETLSPASTPASSKISGAFTVRVPGPAQGTLTAVTRV
jgi:hypothetical protein